jgi:hypothetical protein
VGKSSGFWSVLMGSVGFWWVPVHSGAFRYVGCLDSGGFWWILSGYRCYWPVLVGSGTAHLKVFQGIPGERRKGQKEL